jgi:hypothetical protein
MKRAREAAEAAAEQAQHAAEQARAKANEAAGAASRTASDPATQERLGKQARDAVGLAKRGISTVVERIDPSTLAELIIKATALQEMTNAALRKKGSPYRINEIAIAASIPPGITFAIGRIDVQEEQLTGQEVSSEHLIGAMPVRGEAVISLDGTTIDERGMDEVAAAAAEEVAAGVTPP